MQIHKLESGRENDDEEGKRAEQDDVGYQTRRTGNNGYNEALSRIKSSRSAPSHAMSTRFLPGTRRVGIHLTSYQRLAHCLRHRARTDRSMASTHQRVPCNNEAGRVMMFILHVMAACTSIRDIGTLRWQPRPRICRNIPFATLSLARCSTIVTKRLTCADIAF